MQKRANPELPPWDADGRTIMTPAGHARALSRCLSHCYWVDAFHHAAKLVDFLHGQISAQNASGEGRKPASERTA